ITTGWISARSPAVTTALPYRTVGVYPQPRRCSRSCVERRAHYLTDQVSLKKSSAICCWAGPVRRPHTHIILKRSTHHEQRIEVPGFGRRARRHIQQGLVAEPVESADPRAAFAQGEPDGQAIQLREGVQHAGPHRPAQGRRESHDNVAALVAGGL